MYVGGWGASTETETGDVGGGWTDGDGYLRLQDGNVRRGDGNGDGDVGAMGDGDDDRDGEGTDSSESRSEIVCSAWDGWVRRGVRDSR